MPLSFGLLAGCLAVVVGGFLYAVTRQKTVAVVMIGIGVTLALGTLAVLVLAVTSRM